MSVIPRASRMDVDLNSRTVVLDKALHLSEPHFPHP